MPENQQLDEGVFPSAMPPELSDRAARRTASRKKGEVVDENEILERVVHELQNHLQTIGMGLELLRLTGADPQECQTIEQGIERASRLIREIPEYFSSPKPHLSIQSLAAVVTDVTRQKQEQWHSQGVRLQAACRDPLPALQMDWQQMEKILDRLVACACAFVSAEGGEVEVEAGLREVEAQRYVEVQVSSRGVAPCGVEESEVFMPFRRINGYPLGLSLVLARRTVERHHGQITFQKLSPNHGRFTAILRVH